MLNSHLTPDRATPRLLLMHQSLYKCKPTKWCVSVTKWCEGSLYRGPGLVPSPQQSWFSGGGWLGGHHMADRPCVVKILPRLLWILPCHLLEIVAT
jgi:hypothetical protein